MVMTKSKAHIELEHYLGAMRELDAQRDAGVVDQLHYLIMRNYRHRCLTERSWAASAAFDMAFEHLRGLPLNKSEDRLRVEALQNADAAGYRAWRRSFIRTNIGPVAHCFLDALETVVVPPVPDGKSRERA